MKEPPEIIYLQYYDADGKPLDELDDELTWCSDKINETDVEYVRKDIADKVVKAALNALRSYHYGNASEFLAESVEEYIMRKWYK